MIDSLQLSRRQALLAGASVSLAMAVPTAFAAEKDPMNQNKGAVPMTKNFITTEDGVEIFYKDWGSGQPIVFHHGWPLSSDDWDAQMLYFLDRKSVV